MMFRSAQLEDVKAISRLLSQLTRDHIALDFEKRARELLLEQIDPGSIAEYLKDGYDYQVAESDGRIVGVVATRDDNHLVHLYVADDWQGQGLSRRLWELARDRCLERSRTSRFTVNSSLNAIPVYERFGFLRTGPTRYEDGIPMHPMAIDLPRA